MSEKILVEQQSLTSMTEWMNECFVKQSGKLFTTGDVQSYIKRGHIPEYLGNHKIEREKRFKNVKLYKVIK